MIFNGTSTYTGAGDNGDIIRTKKAESGDIERLGFVNLATNGPTGTILCLAMLPILFACIATAYNRWLRKPNMPRFC